MEPDFFVRTLTLGTATFGGTHGFEDKATQRCLRLHVWWICADAGLNRFDTADMYPRGLVEEILGKAIAGILLYRQTGT